jgi:hypothetical protein
MQRYDAEKQNIELKERLNTAKTNANNISKNQMKLLKKRSTLQMGASNLNVYRNNKLEKAIENGTVEKYKVTYSTFINKFDYFYLKQNKTKRKKKEK